MLQFILYTVMLMSVGNLAVTAVETRAYPAPGTLVSVGGREMHVETQGRGQPNVVLLSGWGTPSPVTDFEPLVSALKRDFTVTVVEPFGYGWSAQVPTPRSNASVVEELRVALREAGVRPPYVLGPHSLSGIYVLYYANKYPHEITAIIGLDTSVPAQARYVQPSAAPFLLAAGHAAGIVRLALMLKPGLAGYDFPPFTETQRGTIRMMAAWNYGGRTLVNEARSIGENMREVQGKTFPGSIPTSFVLSRESIEDIPRELPGLDWVAEHQRLLGRNPRSEVVIVQGGHYVHWRNSELISNLIRETVRTR